MHRQEPSWERLVAWPIKIFRRQAYVNLLWPGTTMLVIAYIVGISYRHSLAARNLKPPALPIVFDSRPKPATNLPPKACRKTVVH